MNTTNAWVFGAALGASIGGVHGGCIGLAVASGFTCVVSFLAHERPRIERRRFGNIVP
jgi:hypothetical protein